VDLLKGPKTVALTVLTTQLGPSIAGCNIIFGVSGGSNFVPLQLSVAVLAVVPTEDFTSAHVEGHRISTATGELYDWLPPDLSLGGPLPLEFRRYYASELRVNGVASRL